VADGFPASSGAGRLAEVLRDGQTDRAIRILGLYRVAEVEGGLLKDESRAEPAYCGVNACIAQQPLPRVWAYGIDRRLDPVDLPGPADLVGPSINWETELYVHDSLPNWVRAGCGAGALPLSTASSHAKRGRKVFWAESRAKRRNPGGAARYKRGRSLPKTVHLGRRNGS
jgi:DNA-binding transcriptional LysR family regulator